MNIRIELRDRELRRALSDLVTAGTNLSPATREIAALLKRITEDAFEHEADPATGEAWAPLSDVTASRPPDGNKKGRARPRKQAPGKSQLARFNRRRLRSDDRRRRHQPGLRDHSILRREEGRVRPRQLQDQERFVSHPLGRHPRASFPRRLASRRNRDYRHHRRPLEALFFRLISCWYFPTRVGFL